MSKVVPDFSQINFLPTGEQAKPSTPGEKTDLFKFFNAVINREKLEIDEQQLEQIFSQDLTIDTKTLSKRLLAVLGEALLYYMTVWPGWQRSVEYYNGQLPCKEWYERFRQYLIFKSNFIIKNAAKFAADPQSKTTSKSVAVQTKVSGLAKGNDKKIAPYTLCVGGPPSVLNNIVFMESNGNILIKQHLEKAWRPLKLHEFLNWLHVSVEVNLPDISITRSNTHRFERFIALCGDLTLLPDVNFISHIKKTPNAGELQPYTYDYIYAYLRQFYITLKKIPGIHANRLIELDAIFMEFLADIKEVNVYNCTMCPDISVGYQIGKCRYIRNKKMVSADIKRKANEQNTINFYEILIPQIEFTLNSFKVAQDFHDQTNVSFQSINRLLVLLNTDSNHPDIENLKNFVNNTGIVYKCTLCTETFSGAHSHFQLTNHFVLNHKAEQDLLCFRCRKEFTVQCLAGQRWKHTCIDPKKGG